MRRAHITVHEVLQKQDTTIPTNTKIITKLRNNNDVQFILKKR
jgi:hypothetical protein